MLTDLLSVVWRWWLSAATRLQVALEKTIQRDSEAYRTWLCINLLSGASEKRLTVERIKNKLSFTCFFFFS